MEKLVELRKCHVAVPLHPASIVVHSCQLCCQCAAVPLVAVMDSGVCAQQTCINRSGPRPASDATLFPEVGIQLPTGTSAKRHWCEGDPIGRAGTVWNTPSVVTMLPAEQGGIRHLHCQRQKGQVCSTAEHSVQTSPGGLAAGLVGRLEDEVFVCCIHGRPKPRCSRRNE